MQFDKIACQVIIPCGFLHLQHHHMWLTYLLFSWSLLPPFRESYYCKSVVCQTNELVRVEILSLSMTPVFSLMSLPGLLTLWLHSWGNKWKGLREKETISWQLLNLALNLILPQCLRWQGTCISILTLYTNNLPIKCKFLAFSTPHLALPSLTSSYSWMITSSLLWDLQPWFQYYVSVVSSANSFFFLCHRNNHVLQWETERIFQRENEKQVIHLHSQSWAFFSEKCFLYEMCLLSKPSEKNQLFMRFLNYKQRYIMAF